MKLFLSLRGETLARWSRVARVKAAAQLHRNVAELGALWRENKRQRQQSACALGGVRNRCWRWIQLAQCNAGKRRTFLGSMQVASRVGPTIARHCTADVPMPVREKIRGIVSAAEKQAKGGAIRALPGERKALRRKGLRYGGYATPESRACGGRSPTPRSGPGRGRR